MLGESDSVCPFPHSEYSLQNSSNFCPVGKDCNKPTASPVEK